MEEKKYKSIDITKPSARQVLSWKDMQNKQISIQKIIIKLKSFFQSVSKLKFANIQNTFKSILFTFKNPKQSYQTIKLKINSWPKRKRIITFSFSSTLAAITIVMVVLQFVFSASITQGATFTWTQSSWAGGSSTDKPNHNDNQNNWTKYNSKDTTIAAAEEVSLTSTSYSAVDSGSPTSPALGFSAGTHTNTFISGTGSGAGVEIAGRPMFVAGSSYFGVSNTRSSNWQSNLAMPNTRGSFFINSLVGWEVGYASIRKTIDGGVTWSAQNIAGTNQLYNLYFNDVNTGWVVGENGVIRKTTDGGTTWSAQTSGTSNLLRSVFFTDANTGWVAGNSGTIRKTTDGGTTWSAQTSGTTKTINKIKFSDTNKGIAIGTNVILQTTDGGSTWNKKMDVDTYSYSQKVFFVNSQTGWLVGNSGLIRKTTDGGITWTTQTSGVWPTWYGAYFTDVNTGWIVGESGTIMKTTDGGATWSAQTSGTTNTLRSIFFTDSNTGWVAGNSGTIRKTTDGGTTWSAQTSGTTNILYSTYFTDANTGWLAGDSGTIRKTTDGGTTWSVQTSGTTNTLRSIFFTDSNTGWVAGNSGTIRKTTDGGTTWSAQTSGTTNQLNSLYFTDANTGWVAGNSGTIRKTTDGGTTWSAQVSGTVDQLNNIYFTDANTGWALGWNGFIMKTSDGGSTWGMQSGSIQDFDFVGNTAVFVGDYGLFFKSSDSANSWGNKLVTTNQYASLRTVSVADDNNYWVVDDSGNPFKTTDGGSNWTQKSSFGFTTNNVKFFDSQNGVFIGSNEMRKTTDGGSTYTWLTGTLRSTFFINSQTGWIVSDYGTIRKTTDGGTTWSAQTSGTTNQLNSVYFTDTNTGWVVGNSGIILKTNNGGTTWSAQTSGTTNPLYSTYFTDSNTGWVAGYSGTILKTTNGGTTWSAQVSGTANQLNSLYFIDANTGWLVGGNGVIRKTTDGGTTWSAPTSGTSYHDLKSVFFINANVGWAAGGSGLTGKVFKSTDGGTNWSDVAGNLNYNLNSISFIDANIGWAVTGYGHIYKTTNGGTTWSTQASDSPFYTNLNSIYIVNSDLSSPSFTSGVIDTGKASSFSTLSYVATLNSQTLTINARAGNTATPDGTWTDWTDAIASGGSISSFSGNRYIQYRANFSTTDPMVSPTLSSVTINYSQYSSSGTLISSAYNTTSPTNTMGMIRWTEDLPTGTDIKFQLQTAPDSAGSPGTWLGFIGPDGTSGTYFTDPTGGESIPSILTSGNNDQWFQYKAYLSSNGPSTPTLSNVRASYVVNATPDFDSSYGTNGVNVSQISDSLDPNWGKVKIDYSIRDVDTTSGSFTQNYVTPTFEYTLDGTNYSDANLSNITFGTAPTNGGYDTYMGKTTNKVLEGSYLTYTAYWDAQTQIPENASDTFHIRVKINDNEGANNTATAISGEETLDTKSPVVSASMPARSGSTSTVTLSTTDDSQNQYRLCNDPTFPLEDEQGNSCEWSTLAGNLVGEVITWTPLKSSEINKPVYIQVRDSLGNITNTTSGFNASQINIDADPNFSSVAIYYGIFDSNVGASTVTPSFEYNTGSGWVVIPSDKLAPGDTSAKTITTTTTYMEQTAHWSAASTISTYAPSTQIRVTATDDLSNVVQTITNSFALDTKAPEPGTHPILINGSTVPATATLDATDDSDLQMKVGLESDLHDVTDWETYADSKTITLATNPDTVYVKFMDDYGNLSSIYSIATPQYPAAMMVQDTSNVNPPDPTEPRLFIAWKVVEVPPPGAASFNRYEVFRSKDTDGPWDYDDPLITIASRTVNYYGDNSVDGTSTYYYKVRAVDDDNNISYFSTTVYGIANGIQDGGEGGGGTDRTDPVIDNVEVSSINTTSAIVTWDTDEVSDSFVGYSQIPGPGTFNENVKGSATMANNEAGVGQHRVVLTNLDPNTDYYFQVSSEDASGNTAEDSNGGTGYTFHTNRGPAIYNKVIKETHNNQVTIAWTTSTDSNTFITYTDTLKEDGTMLNPTQVGNPENVGGEEAPYYHEWTLTELTEGTLYYFSLQSVEDNNNGDAAIDDNGGEFYTFNTDLDKEPPVIDEDSISEPVISSDKVAIYWTTDEPSTSQVQYATEEGGPYTTTEEVSLMNHEHYVVLSDLEAYQEYFYRVVSHDINGHSSTSDEHSFLTERDPQFLHLPIASIIATYTDPVTEEDEEIDLSNSDSIEKFKPSILTDNTAILKFDTFDTEDEYVNSQCQIKYRKDGMTYAPIDFVLEEDYNANHSMSISSLIFSTKYFFEIECTDNLGNAVTSKEFNFTTKEKLYTEGEVGAMGDKTAPSISNVSSGTITGESVTITWDTNEKASSLVRFGITSDYGNMAGNDLVNSDSANYITAHSVIINNLSPSTKYYYKVISVDLSGNIGESSEESFTTESNSSLSSINIVSTSLGEVTVSWSTSKKMTSIVEYGLTDTYGQSKTDSTMASDHETKISGLTIGSIYHFMVKGKDADNNIYSSSDYSFKPKSPPKVNGITVSEIAEHTAKISIATDIPADALITYFEKGNDTNAGSQGKPDFATKHDINLANLKSGTTYSYAVKVSDEQGNQTTSDPKEFTTDQDVTPPIIDSVHTDNALAQSDKVQTIISCKTNEPATASVFYKEGRNGEEKELKMTTNLTTSQVAVITSFKTGTVYNFKIVATDANGNSSTSEVFSLLTPIRKANIVQVIVSNFQDIFGWMKN